MPREGTVRLHGSTESYQDEDILKPIAQISEQHIALNLALTSLVDNF
jgi:hypothetical protein